MKLKLLEAFNGDSILISFCENNANRNILIDGGPGKTFESRNPKNKQKVSGALKIELAAIQSRNEKIDLLILTHCDDDHIDGLLKWFSSDDFSGDLIGEVWYNSAREVAKQLKTDVVESNNIKVKSKPKNLNTSLPQDNDFDDFIEKYKIKNIKTIVAPYTLSRFGVNFQILSPTMKKLAKLTDLQEGLDRKNELLTSKGNDYKHSIKEFILMEDIFIEDNSLTNGTSIAFILSYDKKNLLFLGDAHPSVIVQSLKALKYSGEKKLITEYVKLSHHGSKFNTNSDLLDIIECNKYIISSNGEIHALPDKQCLARILKHKLDANFYFNYISIVDKLFSKEEIPEYSKLCHEINNYTTI